MKILAAGDIHGDVSQVKKLVAKAKKEKVDLVVLCGDITFFEQSIEGLIGPFVKNKQKVIFVPGNHESFATADFLTDVYHITNLHGYSFKINDIGLFGCGGANIGPSSALNEKEIFDILKKGSNKLGHIKKKIMVTHIHPTGTNADKISKAVTGVYTGSKGVEKAVKELKPDIVFCAHAHEASGIEEKVGKTKIIHVGKYGKIIEI